MYKVWLERVDQEPTLLSSARKHGLTRLGYMSLKPEQLSAIDAGEGIPSTGFGKSLVYQVLPFCADWLTGRVTGISTSSKPVVMVVSPLLSLMHDQVVTLGRRCRASRACVRFSRPRFMNTNDICLSSAPHAHKLSARGRNTHGERGSSSID